MSESLCDMIGKTILIEVILIISSAYYSKCSIQESVVDLPEAGKLRGSIITSPWTGNTIYQFLGVKYAENPTGERRFEYPEPVHPWSGIKDAEREPSPCPKKSTYKFVSDESVEDCLSLSVFTNNLETPKPVIVLIVTEFFDSGNSFYDGSYIVDKDVVLVIPQFRTGLLGFFALDKPYFRGNYGVHDVILALTWIQKHISYFGGDPSSVTLAGHLGGAAIVHGLSMGYFTNEDLFHKVIYTSGSLYAKWAFEEMPTKYNNPVFLLDSSHCIHESDVKGCFKNETAENLLRTYYNNKEKLSKPTLYNRAFKMVDDKWCIRSPLTSGLNRAVNPKIYPTLAGVGKIVQPEIVVETLELIFPKPLNTSQRIPKNFVGMLMEVLEIRESSGYLQENIEDYFFSDIDLSTATIFDASHHITDLINTFLYKAPVLEAAKYAAAKAPNSTFLYTFDYNAQNYESNNNNLLQTGTESELMNIFRMDLDPHKKHIEISKILVEMWTSFARDGHPSLLNYSQPPPMTGLNGPYIHIDMRPYIEDNFLKEFTVFQKQAKNGIDLRKY